MQIKFPRTYDFADYICWSFGINELILSCYEYEPRHDKTYNISVRPAKTQISLGIRPVLSESSLFA